ncbi:hypothetical protein PO878_06005 [Iamia majanohamensis]|uniref:Uncharacterized protein n=1 Tax=Iamia majanohamensis TaxID=467976 RepID=A0AAE9YC10_9ACTN|nr:hypothetical protein [Iamia majanohamensis]WCO68279.1 hypothetical protein PO878_06005 [Iamia majanohamensis]
MAKPDLTPTQRRIALGAAAAAVILVVVGLVAVGGDDADDPTASSGTASTTTTAPDDDGSTTTEPGADPNSDAGQSATPTTTEAPTTAAPDPGAEAPGGGEGDDGADPGGDGSGDGEGTGPGTDGGTGGGGGAQPRTVDDPPGGGEGANVGVVDPDDAQSPPVRLPETRDEPCASTGPPQIPLPVTDGPSGDGGRWVTVSSVAGNCGARGGSFQTAGVDTRLVFRSDAQQMIVFVDDLDDPDAAAGYADVECRSRCAGTRILVNRGGAFRLRVQATDGPWTVELQEYRR